jgi:hypothetical protein
MSIGLDVAAIRLFSETQRMIRFVNERAIGKHQLDRSKAIVFENSICRFDEVLACKTCFAICSLILYKLRIALMAQQDVESTDHASGVVKKAMASDSPSPQGRATRPDAICPHCGRITIISTSVPGDRYSCRGCMREVLFDSLAEQSDSAKRPRWYRSMSALIIAAFVLVLALAILFWEFAQSTS